MPKSTLVNKRKGAVIKAGAIAPVEGSFDEVLRLIQQSHRRAY